MNIAATSAHPSASRPTESTGMTRTVGPDHDSVDGVVDPAASGDPGFGQVLSRTLAKGGETDLPSDDAGRSTEPLLGPDGLPLLATTAGPGGVAVDGAALAAASAGRTTVAPDDGKPGDKTERDGDAVGNDLAAQLALVSQWAGIPAATTTAGAGDAATGGSARGLDIKGKLDAIRSGAGRGSAASTATATSDATAAAAAGATLPFAMPTARPSRDAAEANALPTSSAAITSAAELRTRDEAVLAAVGERRTGGEAQSRDGASTGDAASAAGLQSLMQTASAQAAAAPDSASPLQRLHEQVGTPAWSNEVGQATLRMAAGDLQSASLRLNPEHLGPMEVQLRIDNGIAHLAFTAAHTETRQALEASRPTLERMFADQGITVGDCAVGDSSSRPSFDPGATADGSPRDGTAGRWRTDTAGAADGAAATTVTTRLTRALGMVDTFA